MNTEQCKNSDQATSHGISELRESEKNYEEQETGRLGQSGKVSSVCRRNKTWLEVCGVFRNWVHGARNRHSAYVCRFVCMSVCVCTHMRVGEG